MDALGFRRVLFISQKGQPPRADILGVYDSETIIIGEVKSAAESNVVENAAAEVNNLLDALKKWQGASGEYVAFATYVFSGAGTDVPNIQQMGSYVVSNAWVTPASAEGLVVPPPPWIRPSSSSSTPSSTRQAGRWRWAYSTPRRRI